MTLPHLPDLELPPDVPAAFRIAWENVLELEAAELERFHLLRRRPLIVAGDPAEESPHAHAEIMRVFVDAEATVLAGMAVRRILNVLAIRRLAGDDAQYELIAELDEADVMRALIGHLTGVTNEDLCDIVAQIRQEYHDMLVVIHPDQREAVVLINDAIRHVRMARRDAGDIFREPALRALAYGELLGSVSTVWIKTARLAARCTGLPVDLLHRVLSNTWYLGETATEIYLRRHERTVTDDQVRVVLLAKLVFRARSLEIFPPAA